MILLRHLKVIFFLLSAYNILERTPVSFGPGVFYFMEDCNGGKGFQNS